MDRKFQKKELLRSQMMTKIFHETGQFIYIPMNSNLIIEEDDEIPDEIVLEEIEENDRIKPEDYSD